MRVLRLISSVLLLLSLATMAAQAQSTRVKGRVTDSATGEGIPFAAVYFKGTTIGISTDMDGYYTLETRDESVSVLSAELLGYDPMEVSVKLHSFQEINFALKETDNRLAAAVVKPDNSRMKRILALIDEHRDRNNPEKLKYYQCDIYNKMEIDLTNPEENLRNRLINKNFGFIFDYQDTSEISGRPYLPIMISETVSRRYHKDDPVLDKEVIEASRISGVNDDNFLSQFTGSLHLKTNFYNNFINAFEVEIPSPISSSGDLYYNYYLIDSLQIDGRKTWTIRFHPKKLVSSPVFDGEMLIDSKDYALRRIHARLQKGSNVNWLREVIIDVENQVLGDTAWFYKQDKMYLDFCPIMNDSTSLPAAIGRKQMDYSNPEFSRPVRRDIVEAGDNVMVHRDAGKRDDQWWAQARPYELSERESNIYKMVDEIKNVPIYRDIYSLFASFVSGYFDRGKLGYGPLSQIFSYNEIEGARIKLGVRTSNEFSKKVRFSLFGAYGFKDNRFKGGGSTEIVFNNQPTRKLTISGSTDVRQLGMSSYAFDESNIFSSILSKGGGQRRSPVGSYGIVYEHEWTPGFNNSIALETTRIFGNSYVPLIRPSGDIVPSVAATALKYRARFSWDETSTRGAFNKSYIHTKYPVVTFDVSAALEGIARNDYSYLRTEMSVSYRLPLPPAGSSNIRINVGKIYGTVPYPMLKIHEGNGTYFLDAGAFACMDFYEFASDTWATLMYEHNFGGFFLGKIPLLRKAQLREVATFKAAWGTISDHNNGIIGDRNAMNAEILFPMGMTSLEKPYVEMGAGIANILRLFRVDAFWRMSHRYREINGERIKVPHCFALNFGIEFKF